MTSNSVYRCFVLIFLFIFVACAQARAYEVIVTNPVKSINDRRYDFPWFLLQEAMKRTQDVYGDFEIKRFEDILNRKRALHKLVDGEITVFSAATQPDWEETTLPIRIPLRKGLLGYRLLLIRAEDQPIFSSIKTQDALKAYRYGGGQQWSMTSALERIGIKNFGRLEYEELFEMLNKKNFDYFPRGVNEIFNEIDIRSKEFPNMVIAKDIALYLPLPTYFFVSPKKPELAKRLEAGLLSMVNDGTLDEMFFDYHGDFLKRANLSSRKIIDLENKNLSDLTPFDHTEFWYTP